MSTTRVYRLVIARPKGSDKPGWRPACWSDPEYLGTLTWRERRDLARLEFRWPRRRQFLTPDGAERHANRLRWYGADVTVYASDPVTWPVPGEADPLEARGWDDYNQAMRWTPGHPALADALDTYITEKTLEALR